jgi:hypothetical protein
VPQSREYVGGESSPGCGVEEETSPPPACLSCRRRVLLRHASTHMPETTRMPETCPPPACLMPLMPPISWTHLLWVHVGSE